MSEKRMNEIDQGAWDEMERHLAAFADYMARAERDWIRMAMQRCASPIEQRLLGALRFIECPYLHQGGFDMRPLCHWTDYHSDEGMRRQTEIVCIYAQQQVLDYRVDFLLVAKFAHRDELLKVIIECDGHDWHERTKEQAQRDKARDRALTAAGFKVFRFTGSEIFRRAGECAKEIERYLADEELRTREGC